MPDSPPLAADALAGTMAHIAASQGNAPAVAVLAAATPALEITGYDNWNDGIDLLTLFLELPTELYARLFEERERLQQILAQLARPIIEPFPGFALSNVCIRPAVTPPPRWREEARAWLSGAGTNNQGRVRSDNIASRECDGLLFRSQPEINLYRALKAQGVTFAPLPVFIRGGETYRRIEPDFVLVKSGLVFVVEVDGDTVHQESPAEAHARTTMLVHEGAHVERVRASECETLELAQSCARRILAAVEKIRAAR